VIRRLVALASVATLLTWSVLPPVHIHVGEGSDSHDHAEGIIHAHWSAHQDVDFQITLRDGHGRRLVVDQLATVSAHRGDGAAPAVVVPPASSAPLLSLRERRRGTDAATRDGPPGGLSLLRAPPVVA
jgi:hypothetical protein